MTDEEALALTPLIIMGFLLGVVLSAFLFIFRIDRVESENSELKNENHKLEQKLLKLYEEQQRKTE